MTKTIALKELAPSVVKEALDAGDDLTITEDDKPIGRVIPIERRKGPLEGTITFHGDIVEPLGIKWEADE